MKKASHDTLHLIGEVGETILGGFVNDYVGLAWKATFMGITYSQRGRYQREAREAEAQERSDKLNMLVGTGQFEDAVRYVAGLGLPYHAQTEIVAQIQRVRPEIEERMREHKRRVAVLKTIEELAQRGQVKEAIGHSQQLHLDWDAQRQLDAAIREAAETAARRSRQADDWMNTLSGLVGRGDLKGAQKFVKSLPIAEQGKKQMLAVLGDMAAAQPKRFR